MGRQEDYVLTWVRDRVAKIRAREEADLFPFDSPREGQAAFLSNCRNILHGGGHLVAHAPTGVGKTAASLTGALEAAIKEGGMVFFLTSRQTQHKIAIDTLRLMRRKAHIVAVDVVGKQSMCVRRDKPEGPAFMPFCAEQCKAGKCPFNNRYEKNTYSEMLGKPLHVDELVASSMRAGMCPYRVAMDMMEFADVVVCDYNYFFGGLMEKILSQINRPLSDIILVVDEAHNLPDRIRNEHTSTLSPYLVGEAFKECRGDRRLQHYLMLLQDVFLDFNKEGEGKVDKGLLPDLMAGVLSASLKPLTYDEFSDALREKGEKKAMQGEPSACLELSDFLDMWVMDVENAARLYKGGEKPSLTFRLLDPSYGSKDIFEGVFSSLLMSGTLYPMKMYRDILGLEPRRTVLKEYTSPFPQKNRPIVVDTSVTTKYSERSDDMFQLIAENLRKYIVKVPGNAAVFFQSYSMLKEISGRLKVRSKERWVESQDMRKEEKDMLMEHLLHSKKNKGTVVMGVMGASLAEGIDYYDNALDMVAVVGLPLAPPTLETELVIEFYTNLFGADAGQYYGYIQPAMNKVLQAAGRAIRSANDRAVVALMDNRFTWGRYRNCFPKDFNPRESEDIEQGICDFFNIETKK